MKDRVFIEGLHLAGMHGVLEHERQIEQEFVVDILAAYDAEKAAKSDKIIDAVDYVRFRDIARKVISGKHNYLIERIAGRIATEILKDARIGEVTVTIRKPAVLASGVPGVSITRCQRS
jgi:dihydroneopterin aldolase